MHADKVIVFYDGACILCNASVQLLIKRDAHNKLYYAHLQSSIAKEMLSSASIDPDALKSLILFENGEFFTHSTGVLRTLKYLDRPWRWLRILLVVPTPIRDSIYNHIAKHRYQWFGQTETCMIPSEEIKRRFLS